MRILNLLTSLVAIGFAAQAVAEEVASSEKKFGYSNAPEAQTLPEGVARFRLPYQAVTGNTSYDKDGNKSDSAAKVTAAGGSIVAEYGISNKLSLQMRMDYRKNQTVKLTDEFKAATLAQYKPAAYTSTFGTLAKSTGVSITDQATLETALKTAIIGGCAPTYGAATCATLYGNGTLKSNTLPASLTGSFGAGSATVSAKDWVSAAGTGTEAKVISGVNAEIDSNNYSGNAALGDTIVGALYNFAQEENFWGSLGAGLRIPTGNRNLALNEQDTTRSAYEFGLRLDLDYLPTDWLTITAENQMELPLMGTKREVGGVSHEIKRKGIRNVGFVTVKPSLEVLHPSLNAVKTNLGVKFDYDNGELDTSEGSTTGGERTQQMWKYVSVGYSFLHSMKVPVQLDVDYEIPHSGKNVDIAITKTTATLKAFAKF